ncbi:MAG TPA: hypothetical protein VH370_11145 [Humisphaera sp.]|nr:hypothetical protein [Humisphaera sp.]
MRRLVARFMAACPKKQTLSTAFVVLSLGAAMVVAVFWVRGRSCEDAFFLVPYRDTEYRYRFFLRSVGGGVGVSYVRLPASWGNDPGYFGHASFKPKVLSYPAEIPTRASRNMPLPFPHPSTLNMLGFIFTCDRIEPTLLSIDTAAPCWSVILIFLAPPTAWAYRRILRRGQPGRGFECRTIARQMTRDQA